MSVPRERTRRAPYYIPRRVPNNHGKIVENWQIDRALAIAGAIVIGKRPGENRIGAAVPDGFRGAPIRFGGMHQ